MVSAVLRGLSADGFRAAGSNQSQTSRRLVLATELVQTIRHEGTRQAVTGEGSFYAPGAKILEDVDVANTILYAVTQPTHVNVSELLIRPTIQAF
jgi:NADP-dependent 3-hydroxy acid dehydrogenase YdfG